MAMLRLSRIFKNYDETGSLSEQINLYGFIGPHVFLTKSGEVGVILEVRGVDYEYLDGGSIEEVLVEAIVFIEQLQSRFKTLGEAITNFEGGNPSRDNRSIWEHNS
jgi:hypothetical protein